MFNLVLYTIGYGLCLALICAVFIILYQFFYWKIKRMPHINVTPIIGHTGPFLLKQESFMDVTKRLYFNFEDFKYYGSFDFTSPVLVIKDPDIIREICVKSFDSFPDHRNFVSEEWDPVIGKNVFSLTGQRWREVRNTLSPSFTANKMKFMFKLVEECSKNFVNYFVNNPKFAEEFEAKDAMTRYTNDVIATVAFGVEVNSMKNKNNEFYKSGKDLLNFNSLIIIKFILSKFFPNLMRKMGFTFLSNKSDKFFKKLVNETVGTRKEHGIVRPDMMHLMMQALGNENGVKFTIDDMIGQSFIFFLAGFETSATLMCLACHELAANPDVQEKLRAEIDEHFQENTEITYESLVGLKYLDNVINETLRMYPPAPLLDRVCVKEYELPPPKDGYPSFKIKPGTVINVPTCGFHNDSKYFPNPDNFDPDRFDNKNIDPYIFMPFGLGPRKCIGNRFALMETKILIIHILQKFFIQLTEKSCHPIVFTKKTFGLVPDNGFWFKFEERKKRE